MHVPCVYRSGLCRALRGSPLATAPLSARTVGPYRTATQYPVVRECRMTRPDHRCVTERTPMDPYNADEFAADESTTGVPENASGATSSTERRRNRGLVFGAVGVVVAAAVAATVFVFTGGAGGASDTHAAEGPSTTPRISVSLPTSTGSSEEAAQPPGSVR